MARHAHAFKPRSQIPSGVWFLFGVITGIGIAFLGYQQFRDKFAPESPAAGREPTTLPVPPAANTDPGANPPRFDFYTILPEKEVVVPDQDDKRPVEIKEAREVEEPQPVVAAPAAKPAPEKKTKPEPKPTSKLVTVATAKKGNYVLQVGSFKRMDEADRLRASLALIGIESSVQIVQLGDGEQWHRVRVGPFETNTQANEVRGKLKQNKYNSILLQVKS